MTGTADIIITKISAIIGPSGKSRLNGTLFILYISLQINILITAPGMKQFTEIAQLVMLIRKRTTNYLLLIWKLKLRCSLAVQLAGKLIQKKGRNCIGSLKGPRSTTSGTIAGWESTGGQTKIMVSVVVSAIMEFNCVEWGILGCDCVEEVCGVLLCRRGCMEDPTVQKGDKWRVLDDEKFFWCRQGEIVIRFLRLPLYTSSECPRGGGLLNKVLYGEPPPRG